MEVYGEERDDVFLGMWSRCSEGQPHPARSLYFLFSHEPFAQVSVPMYMTARCMVDGGGFSDRAVPCVSTCALTVLFLPSDHHAIHSPFGKASLVRGFRNYHRKNLEILAHSRNPYFSNPSPTSLASHSLLE